MTYDEIKEVVKEVLYRQVVFGIAHIEIDMDGKIKVLPEEDE
jgi:hypothetical protein